VVIQNGNGFPLQILPPGFAPVDVLIPATEKIMRGKLWQYNHGYLLVSVTLARSINQPDTMLGLI